MITYKELLQEGRLYLKKHDIESHWRDAEVLLCHVFLLKREALLLVEDTPCDEGKAAIYRSLLERRGRYEPVSYILGYRSFWKDDFIVNHHVLDPRPDTEMIVEGVLSYYPKHEQHLTVLDLGCGSGCLILSLLREYHESSGIAVDYSLDALSVARANAKKLGLDDRVTYVHSYWGDALDNDCADIIVSNPPYITTQDVEHLMPDVRLYEPRLALDGGMDGLDCYKQVLKDSTRLLKKEGRIFLECGAGQFEAILSLGEALHLVLLGGIKDLAGHERVIVFQKV